MTRERRTNRSTTNRLKGLIEAELRRQNLTEQEAAREARLPVIKLEISILTSQYAEI